MSRGRRGRQQGSTKGDVISRVIGTSWRDKTFTHEGRRFVLWAHVLHLACGHEIETTASRSEEWRTSLHPSKKVCPDCTSAKHHAWRESFKPSASSSPATPAPDRLEENQEP